MTESSRKVVRYRIARAWESLDEARVMADTHHWNTCVNRLYYACFYAVSALLLRDGHGSNRHTGVRALFNTHYVRTGIIDKQTATVYNDLFERRQESDYEDLFSFDADEVLPWMGLASTFVQNIGEKVETSGHG